MSCDARYATADEFANFFCIDLPLSAAEQTAIESALDISVGTIHLALASVGACDCSMTLAGSKAMGFLNIVLAAIFRECPCARVVVSPEVKRMWMELVNTQLEALVDGRLEVCNGATGSLFPSVGWAPQPWTAFNSAVIRINNIMRNSG